MLRKAGAKALKDRTLDNMERFYYSLDLSALWNAFYTKVGTDGRPVYKTARQFAIKTGRNGKQQDLLKYICGPKPGDQTIKNMYPFLPDPLDFDNKRENGGWFTEKNLQAHSLGIRRQINALDALRDVGNGITIHSLSRMENLARQWDREFGGHFFADGLGLKENAERAKLYVDIHARLLSMIAQAQDIYAKSHGINFQDMSGFERLLAAQAMAINASGGAAKESRTEQVLARIVEMALEKAPRHGITLPADVENAIVMSPSKEDDKKSVM